MDKRPFRPRLPGTVFLKKDRWWWKVRLPGEDRTRDRALKPNGSRSATTDRSEAEQIAVAMWTRAMELEAESRVRAETNDITRVYAEEISKIKSEAARAVAKLRSEAEQALATERARYDAQAQEHAAVLAKAGQTLADVKADCERRMREMAESRAEIPDRSESTGTCECCGAQGIPRAELEAIDSGQMLCKACLAALRSMR